MAAAELVLPAKFDFRAAPVAPGVRQVLPAALFSAETGYGFEPGATPAYFSVALPEGNYRVTVTLGAADGESATTIKAELRRLMLENVRTAAGKFETRSFVVNVRTPRIAPGGEVKLKDRERLTEMANWDDS